MYIYRYTIYIILNIVNIAKEQIFNIGIER